VLAAAHAAAPEALIARASTERLDPDRRFEAIRGGVLFLLPLLEGASWPLQQLLWGRRWLRGPADADIGVGRASYAVLIVANRREATPSAQQ